MMKNKSKMTLSEHQKVPMLEENMYEVNQKLLDLRSKLYEYEQQTRAIID